MSIRDEIIHKLILKKGFSLYPEDKYHIKEIIKFSKEKYSEIGGYRT